MNSNRNIALSTGIVALAALVWVFQLAWPAEPAPTPSAPTPHVATSNLQTPESSSSPAARGGHTTAAELDQLVGQVDVVASRPDVAGYERDCGSAGACSFGQAWTDDHPGTGGHNGCDTRNDVLRHDLRNVTTRPGTDDCVVISGTLAEPYTGRVVVFDKAHAQEVQIDHVYPLRAAWDLGASTWSPQRRQQFANDQARNLLAVDGRTHASKGDRTPGEWLPLNRAGVCDYLARYLEVAHAYKLPITAADAGAVRDARPACVSSNS